VDPTVLGGLTWSPHSGDLAIKKDGAGSTQNRPHCLCPGWGIDQQPPIPGLQEEVERSEQPSGRRRLRSELSDAGGEVPGSSSRPARSAESRNGISYKCVALHAGQNRRYAGSIKAVTWVETSPLAIGLVTTDRIAAATASRASRLLMPAAFSGLAASKIRLPAPTWENGSTAAATYGRCSRW